LQFTDRAHIADRLVDCNAFRGTEQQLRDLLYPGPSATARSPQAAPREDDTPMQVELRFYNDNGTPDPAGLNFRGACPAEAANSSMVVDRAWVRWVSYWGASTFRVVAWDDTKPLGEADPSRGWWELPAAVRGFTVEGRRPDPGTQPAVTLITRAKT
jgi:hypothetical protein